MPQMLLPFYSEERTPINSLISYVKRDGYVWYFNDVMPIFRHEESDINSFKMFVSQLYVNGNAKQVEIVKAFGVNPLAVKRWVKKYIEGGPEAFYKPRKVRSATVLTEEKLNEIQNHLDQGYSVSHISKLVSVKKDTIYKAIIKGKLRKKKL